MINHDFLGAYEDTQERRPRRLGPEETSGQRECQKHPWGQNGQCQRHVIENASERAGGLLKSFKYFIF